MTDPLDLVRAANPDPDPAPLAPARAARMAAAILAHDPRPRGRDWLNGMLRRLSRPRLFALVAAVLAVAGGTAAAVTVLTDQPSAPPSGRFKPSAPSPPGTAATPVSYHVTLTPDLNGGAVGWCLQWHLYFGQGSGGGGPCGVVALTGKPIIGTDAGSESDLISHLNPKRRPAWLTYANVSDVVFVTTAQVAAVRLTPRLTVRTRRDSQLPAGYRIAVIVRESVTHIRAHPYRPGTRPPRPVIPSLPGPGAAVALDAKGHQLPTAATTPRLREPGAFWQASASHGVGPQPTLHKPPAAACEIYINSLPGARPSFGSVVQHVQGYHQLTGPTFLTCAKTWINDHGAINAAILLNAQNPRKRPPPIPNATTVPGHPMLVNEPANDLGTNDSLTAERIGNAWLVIETTGTLAHRINIIRRIHACVRIGRAACPPTT